MKAALRCMRRPNEITNQLRRLTWAFSIDHMITLVPFLKHIFPSEFHYCLPLAIDKGKWVELGFSTGICKEQDSMHSLPNFLFTLWQRGFFTIFEAVSLQQEWSILKHSLLNTFEPIVPQTVECFCPITQLL